MEKIVHKKSILFCLCCVYFMLLLLFLLLYALSIHDFHYSIHPLPQMFYKTYTNTNKIHFYCTNITNIGLVLFHSHSPNLLPHRLPNFWCLLYVLYIILCRNALSEYIMYWYFFFIAFIRLYTTYSAWLQKNVCSTIKMYVSTYIFFLFYLMFFSHCIPVWVLFIFKLTWLHDVNWKNWLEYFHILCNTRALFKWCRILLIFKKSCTA